MCSTAAPAAIPFGLRVAITSARARGISEAAIQLVVRLYNKPENARRRAAWFSDRIDTMQAHEKASELFVRSFK